LNATERYIPPNHHTLEGSWSRWDKTTITIRGLTSVRCLTGEWLLTTISELTRGARGWARLVVESQLASVGTTEAARTTATVTATAATAHACTATATATATATTHACTATATATTHACTATAALTTHACTATATATTHACTATATLTTHACAATATATAHACAATTTIGATAASLATVTVATVAATTAVRTTARTTATHLIIRFDIGHLSVGRRSVCRARRSCGIHIRLHGTRLCRGVVGGGSGEHCRRRVQARSGEEEERERAGGREHGGRGYCTKH